MGIFAVAVACALALPLPAALSAHAKEKEKVLYSFGSDTSDGNGPIAGVIDVKGMLYGTTSGGGDHYAYGTVFSLDLKTGTKSVLHSFGGGMDGAFPVASLVDVEGLMYGTTDAGGGAGCGGYGCGTVFSVDPSTGAETVLYSFCSQQNCKDGASPHTSLIAAHGVLYGTAEYGGNPGCYNNGCGTVFSIDPSTGAETVLYSFCSQTNCADGADPVGSLIQVNGRLYGTTIGGGGSLNPGTVFSIDLKSGVETVLYTFCTQQNCTDGAGPYAGFIDVKGTLYGTTADGGTDGVGTVFSLDPNTGVETVLYSFCPNGNPCTDGQNPGANLTYMKGRLYGTTPTGGTYGYGTVFAVDASTGAEKLLYSFCPNSQPCTDGATPTAALIDVMGTLYGTTKEGGANGGGTAFALRKP